MTLKALQLARQEIATLTAKLAESEEDTAIEREHVRQCVTNIAKLKQQLAEAQRDAERYRFLRNWPLDDEYKVGWYVIEITKTNEIETAPARNLETLDVAIDEAMARSAADGD